MVGLRSLRSEAYKERFTRRKLGVMAEEIHSGVTERKEQLSLVASRSAPALSLSLLLSLPSGFCVGVKVELSS